MFQGLTTFTFEEFRELIKKEDFDKLIYNCYYCHNQEDILLYLEKFINQNNFIINYIYIRNNYQLGKFNDPDVVRKCLSLATKTLFIVLAHINICTEINKYFEILGILTKKFDEKFKDYVKKENLQFAINFSKKEVLQFIDTMSGNISIAENNIPGSDKKKMLDLPEPYLICNVQAGAWRYPAIKYNNMGEEQNNINNGKFIKNYSARCQKYYDAYQYLNDKLNLLKNSFDETEKIEFSKFFVK